VTGLSREVLAELVAELGPRWQACQDARLADRRRQRAMGAGARHWLVFVARLLATLVYLRHGVTHDVLACWFGVSRSTITRAVASYAHCWGERGCTVEDGVRLHTGADVVTHLGASGQVNLLNCLSAAIYVREREDHDRSSGRPSLRSRRIRSSSSRSSGRRTSEVTAANVTASCFATDASPEPDSPPGASNRRASTRAT
jgi:Helix-turn-helix of DDE superfamily endonuclease